jgi:hypothetical protein
MNTREPVSLLVVTEFVVMGGVAILIFGLEGTVWVLPLLVLFGIVLLFYTFGRS